MNNGTTIQQSTQAYERWMAGYFQVLQADLAAKHVHMVEDSFSFLRATFYRWSQLFPVLCPELNGAPLVLGVGDLHVENYGTWRDAEGRLVWGINDFDEAVSLPYANDLVRLAASAWLAIDLNHLALDPAAACATILEGYADGLTKGGGAYVLSEHHGWLREAVTSHERDHERFWKKLDALPPSKSLAPAVRSLLKKAMPEAGLDFKVAHRRAGLGSLGRPRFTAIAEWHGGRIAREGKTLLPSAWGWANSAAKDKGIYYEEILRGAVRAADPFLTIHGTWVIRRLSPYCSRVELSQLTHGHDEMKLLRAMGWELANVHLGTRGAAARIRQDLKRRKSNWLHQAAEVMILVTLRDWKAWRK